MWISGGDQELSENIFHMVLAKIRPAGATSPEEEPAAAAAAGVKGISLFLVPKHRLPHQAGANGSSARRRNGVALAGLNHKMGMCVAVVVIAVRAAGGYALVHSLLIS